MKLASLYRKYLRGSDLSSPLTVKILGIKLVTVQPHPSIPMTEKWCLMVTGLPEDLPNSILVGPKAVDQLVSIFGNIDSQELKDKQVTVFPLQLKVGKDQKVGIRFRKANGNGSKPAPPEEPDLPF